jgi:hypothetical protein
LSKFVCYTVEGLMQQGRNQVWVMLGTYPTADSARLAAESARTGSGVVESRVMSYFRSADWWRSPEAPSAAVRAPHVAPQKAATRGDEASIVA